MGTPFVDWLDTLRAWASNATNAELAEAVAVIEDEFRARNIAFDWWANMGSAPAPAKVQ